MEVDPADMTPDEREEARESARQDWLARAALASAASAVVVFARQTWRWVIATPSGGVEDVVRDRTVRSAFDKAINSQRADTRALTRALVNGDVSLAEWQRQMMDTIKDVHLNAASLAKGGYGNLTQRDFGEAGATIKSEYEYLQRFAEQIEDGAQRLDGTAIRRADMYVQKARRTHHVMHRREMQKIGYNQEKNVLGVAEHCEECVALTSRGDDGWVPNGTLTPVGERICLSNCQCFIYYRRTTTTDPDLFPVVRK